MAQHRSHSVAIQFSKSIASQRCCDDAKHSNDQPWPGHQVGRWSFEVGQLAAEYGTDRCKVRVRLPTALDYRSFHRGISSPWAASGSPSGTAGPLSPTLGISPAGSPSLSSDYTPSRAAVPQLPSPTSSGGERDHQAPQTKAPVPSFAACAHVLRRGNP